MVDETGRPLRPPRATWLRIQFDPHEKEAFVVSLSSVSSEATEWVIKIQTSGSLDELWPAFEAWLYGDQAHWNAFVQAQDAWQRLDWLKNPCVRQDPAFV